MKTLLTTFVLSILTLGVCPSTVPAADVVKIDPEKYAAIAYSPDTQHYGYAWNFDTREAAEEAALREVPEDDARILSSTKFGWIALVVSEDGAYGYRTLRGEGANGTDAFNEALENMRERSDAKVKIAIVVCSGDIEPMVISPTIIN